MSCNPVNHAFVSSMPRDTINKMPETGRIRIKIEFTHSGNLIIYCMFHSPVKRKLPIRCYGLAEKKLTWELITERARQNPARIAIGIELRAADAVHLAESASRQGFAEVLVVSAEKQETSLEQDISDNPPARLVELLVNGEVQGVVRGSLSSSECLEAIKNGFGINNIYRAALLQDAPAENIFLLSPIIWA